MKDFAEEKRRRKKQIQIQNCIAAAKKKKKLPKPFIGKQCGKPFSFPTIIMDLCYLSGCVFSAFFSMPFVHSGCGGCNVTINAASMCVCVSVVSVGVHGVKTMTKTRRQIRLSDIGFKFGHKSDGNDFQPNDFLEKYLLKTKFVAAIRVFVCEITERTNCDFGVSGCRVCNPCKIERILKSNMAYSK